jgi:filamentous hemagglutinin
MNFLNYFNNTGKYNIRMTQFGVDRNKSQKIKESMKSGNYDFEKDSNRIGFETFNNVFYITEGHHRMQAALELWKETKYYSFVDKLIQNGLRCDINKLPKSYRFKI